MKTSELLRTEIADATADAGPMRRGTLKVFLFTVLGSIVALAVIIAGGLVHEKVAPAVWGLGGVALALSLWGWWIIYSGWRGHVKVPKSHGVLGGELGFDVLFTCRGVAATVFFVKDRVKAGEQLNLMIFLENYMSRQRVVRARIGALAGVGRPEREMLQLHLAAGQAAVYVLPMRAAGAIEEGMHRVTVTMHVEAPNGVGQRLQGTRVRIFDIPTCRFAAPFKVDGKSEAAAVELPKGRYLMLGSVSEKAPRLEGLEALVGRIAGSGL